MNAIKILTYSKIISIIGTSMRLIVWPIQAYILTNDPRIMAVVLLADTIGGLVGSLISGYIVDLYNRKNIIVIDELISAASTLMIGFLTKDTIYFAIPLSILWGISNSIASNAQDILVDDVKCDNDLRTQYAEIDKRLNYAAITTYFVASLFVERLGAKLVFVVDALTFVICAFMISRIKYTFSKKHISKTINEKFNFIVEGFKYGFLNNKTIFVLCSIMAFASIAQGLTYTITLPYIFERFSASSIDVSICRTIAKVGFIAGAFILQRKFVKSKGNFTTIAFALAIMIVAYVGAGFALHIYVFFAFLFLSFFALQILRISNKTECIQQTPDELKGRVTSLRFFFGDLFYLIGTTIAVRFATKTSSSRIFIIAAGIYVFAFLILTYFRVNSKVMVENQQS